jgi:hypothetical protein
MQKYESRIFYFKFSNARRSKNIRNSANVMQKTSQNLHRKNEEMVISHFALHPLRITIRGVLEYEDLMTSEFQALDSSG